MKSIVWSIYELSVKTNLTLVKFLIPSRSQILHFGVNRQIPFSCKILVLVTLQGLMIRESISIHQHMIKFVKFTICRKMQNTYFRLPFKQYCLDRFRTRFFTQCCKHPR